MIGVGMAGMGQDGAGTLGTDHGAGILGTDLVGDLAGILGMDLVGELGGIHGMDLAGDLDGTHGMEPVGVGIIGIIHTVMVTTEEIYHTIMDQEATTVTTTTEAVLEITTI